MNEIPRNGFWRNVNHKLITSIVGLGLITFAVGFGLYWSLLGSQSIGDQELPEEETKGVVDQFVVSDQESIDLEDGLELEEVEIEDSADVLGEVEQIVEQPDPATVSVPGPTTYRQFTGQQFVDYYDTIVYSNVTSLETKPFITGDENIDSYIQSLAEGRGYKLRGESLIGANQPVLNSQVSLLQGAASQEAGLNLVAVSGYRSVANQRSIFLNAMANAGVDQSQILSGTQDSLLDSILVTRSIPGYSKHHTGYTMDFGCNSSNLLSFGSTPCFLWLSENNYYNAKRFGFLPSYPEGALNQGPNPEAWEYVWVGEENLIQ